MCIFSDILGILINVITDFIFYFIDAEREKKGLPSNYRFYEDSLSGGGMNFVEFYRYDLEKIKSTEDQFANEKRLKYVYKDNSGNEQWRAVLTGRFTYDGNTATCTSSSCSVTVVNDAWYVVSKSTSKSGNSALGDLTMGRKFLGITIEKKTINMKLTCDKNGTLS